MTKAQNKTRVTAIDPTGFIASIDHPTRRADAETLDRLFRRVTGFLPRMWGPTMIGYGQYHYRYDSGREGDFLATGFSPRRANLSIYILPGYADIGPILSRLGKHRTCKSCLYVNKLADIDPVVLEELIRAGREDLGRRWPVTPG